MITFASATTNTMRRHPIFWIIAYLLILAASQVFHLSDWTIRMSFMGFPGWLLYFAGLHLIYILLLWLHMRSAKKQPDQ